MEAGLVERVVVVQWPGGQLVEHGPERYPRASAASRRSRPGVIVVQRGGETVRTARPTRAERGTARSASEETDGVPLSNWIAEQGKTPEELRAPPRAKPRADANDRRRRSAGGRRGTGVWCGRSARRRHRPTPHARGGSGRVVVADEGDRRDHQVERRAAGGRRHLPPDPRRGSSPPPPPRSSPNDDSSALMNL